MTRAARNRRYVWVLEENRSVDVPQGCMGVYQTKAAGMAAARAYIQDTDIRLEVNRDSERPRWESWSDETGDNGLRLWRWLVEA